MMCLNGIECDRCRKKEDFTPARESFFSAIRGSFFSTIVGSFFLGFKSVLRGLYALRDRFFTP